MEEFKKLVNEHDQSTFPVECYGKSINDTSLTVLNSEITSRLLTLVETEGQLSSRSKKELLIYQIQLQEILPELNGNAKNYFENLLNVVRMVGLE